MGCTVKKIIIILTIIMMLQLCIISCSEEENVSIYKEFIGEYKIDNSASIDELVDCEYELKDLYEYFGVIPYNENVIYSVAYESKSMADVNKKFSIECIRGEGLSLYTVYRVKEGGYFYVFWTCPTNLSSGADEESVNVIYTAYIPALKEEKDFSAIINGESTAEDVANIDPSLELNFAVSSGVCSFTLLRDGKIMKIEYTAGDNVKSREDLVVKEKAVFANDKLKSSSYLASIHQEDLP